MNFIFFRIEIWVRGGGGSSEGCGPSSSDGCQLFEYIAGRRAIKLCMLRAIKGKLGWGHCLLRRECFPLWSGHCTMRGGHFVLRSHPVSSLLPKQQPLALTLSEGDGRAATAETEAQGTAVVALVCLWASTKQSVVTSHLSDPGCTVGLPAIGRRSATTCGRPAGIEPGPLGRVVSRGTQREKTPPSQ